MTSTEYKLPPSAMIGIANLIHFMPEAKVDREMSPTIAMAMVTLTPKHFPESPSGSSAPSVVVLTALATDRYMVCRYTVELPAEFVPEEEAVFGLSYDLLKNLKPKSDDGDWTVTVTPDEHPGSGNIPRGMVTVSTDGRGVTEPTMGGNFPPVGRLIPDGDDFLMAPDGYSLRVSYIARMGKVADPGAGRVIKEEAWRMQGTGVTENGKPKPVLWTTTFSGIHKYEVLLQPNLTLR